MAVNLVGYGPERMTEACGVDRPVARGVGPVAPILIIAGVLMPARIEPEHIRADAEAIVALHHGNGILPGEAGILLHGLGLVIIEPRGERIPGHLPVYTAAVVSQHQPAKLVGAIQIVLSLPEHQVDAGGANLLGGMEVEADSLLPRHQADLAITLCADLGQPVAGPPDAQHDTTTLRGSDAEEWGVLALAGASSLGRHADGLARRQCDLPGLKVCRADLVALQVIHEEAARAAIAQGQVDGLYLLQGPGVGGARVLYAQYPVHATIIWIAGDVAAHPETVLRMGVSERVGHLTGGCAAVAHGLISPRPDE